MIILTDSEYDEHPINYDALSNEAVLENLGKFNAGPLYKHAEEVAEKNGDRLDELDGRQFVDGLSVYELGSKEYLVVDGRSMRGVNLRVYDDIEPVEEVPAELNPSVEQSPTSKNSWGDVEGALVQEKEAEAESAVESFITGG